MNAQEYKLWKPLFQALEGDNLEHRDDDELWRYCKNIDTHESIHRYRIKPKIIIKLGDMITSKCGARYIVTGLRTERGRDQFLVNNSWINVDEFESLFT